MSTVCGAEKHSLGPNESTSAEYQRGGTRKRWRKLLPVVDTSSKKMRVGNSGDEIISGYTVAEWVAWAEWFAWAKVEEILDPVSEAEFGGCNADELATWWHEQDPKDVHVRTTVKGGRCTCEAPPPPHIGVCCCRGGDADSEDDDSYSYIDELSLADSDDDDSHSDTASAVVNSASDIDGLLQNRVCCCPGGDEDGDDAGRVSDSVYDADEPL